MAQGYPLKIKLDIVGEKIFDLPFYLMKQINDLTPAFQAVYKYLCADVALVFKNQGRDGWVHLSPSYEAWKVVTFPGQPILVRTGTLKNSFQEGGQYHIRVINGKQMIMGSDVPYALDHQKGRPERRLPARKIYDLREKQENNVKRIITEFVLKGAILSIGTV